MTDKTQCSQNSSASMLTKKEQRKKWSKSYYDSNKEKRRAQNKSYYESNKERLYSQQKLRQKDYQKNYQKEYREKHKAKQKEYKKQYERIRKNTDSVYKFLCSIRSQGSRIVRQLALGKKPANTFEWVGCSPEELKSRFESLFTEGMSWDNYGEWHIDHIRPVSSFKPEEWEQINHYTNLQPLWAKDNISKRDHWNRPSTVSFI